jgi:hypothetical protein
MDGKGDIIDQGNEAAEIFRRSALSQRQPEGPAATGYCFNCEANLHNTKMRWCDAGCRDDWEKQRRAAAMAPREPDEIAK